MIRTLIIDDEPIGRRVLRKLLSAHPQHVVVGEAGTFAQAQARLAQADYELVLLDIQLRGGNGFDLVPAIRPEARTIFVTAYDRYALRAFEVNAIDYLLKPVTEERFAAAVRRLGPAAASAGGTWADGGIALAPDDSVLVRTDAGDRFVPVVEIAAVLSNGNYSDVHLRSGQRLFTRRTMKTWDELLPPTHFARVHRHALVNVACVEQTHRDTRETLELRISGVRDTVGVSRNYVGDLLARLSARPA
jgi:two-component system LytT family response regulator